MRYVLSFIIALTLFGSVQTFAQEGGGSLIANVDIADVTHTREGREVTVSFSLSNEGGVQPGVKYGVMLQKSTGDGDRVIADEYVYDEEITLQDGESITRTVVYTAPLALEGEYTLAIMSRNTAGLPLALVEGGTVAFQNAPTTLRIDTESCYVTIGSERTKYAPYELVTLDANETLVSHCTITNTEPGPVTFTPGYETRSGSTFGSLVPSEGGTSEMLTLDANETVLMSTPLPRAQGAGTYAVTLAYDSDGNDVTYVYTTGSAPRIVNALLNATSYGPGKSAEVGLMVSGVGEQTITLALHNEDGVQCAEPVFQGVTVTGVTRVDMVVPVERTCANPEVRARITSNADGAYGEYITRAAALPKPTMQNSMNPIAPGAPFDFGPTFFICVIALAAGLGIFYHSMYRKSKVNMPEKILILLMMLTFGFGIASHSAEAATFTQNNGTCSVSISYDPVSAPIRPGQSIAINGYTSCPGLRVNAQLINSGYTFSVTANSSGGIFGSYTAPSADDVINYVSGDMWERNPLSGELMYPRDYVFVNRCAPSTIDYCSVPPYESYFGESVGTSAGACVSGSTGSCNYTCQSDLTWRRNSNTCTAPVVPPGSTPEFTSTPSCTIGSNAASCTATVSVFVPSSYAWGADLKTCSGTLLQTISPGSHTVTVTIPYNTACFNLHPWAMFPVPATDTVTGSSACITGTTWNNTVCAPLPPPPAPTGLATETWGSCGAKTIKLIWNPVAGATRYDVERDGILISAVPNPYFDTVTVDGSVHTYRVRAWNASGPSAWSSPIQGTAPDACVTTGSLNITACTIQAGQSTCNATVRWTSNAVLPSVLHNGTQFSTVQSNSTGTSRPVGYGNNTFTLRDGSRDLDQDVVPIGCVIGTTWVGGVCTIPVPPPSTRPCNGTVISNCQLDPTAHGGTDGTCNPATHTGTCSYTCSDGTWGAPSSNSCTLIPVPPPVVTGPPVLTASSLLVRIGTPVTIRWDTNNGNENLCTLTGGALGTTQSPIPLNPSDPSAEEGSVTQTINGRTTYTLTCPSGSTTITIDVIPQDSET